MNFRCQNSYVYQLIIQSLIIPIFENINIPYYKLFCYDFLIRQNQSIKYQTNSTRLDLSDYLTGLYLVSLKINNSIINHKIIRY